MVKEQILNYTWGVIVALGILFTLTKFIVIRILGIERLSPAIFFSTLRNTNRYVIVNSDDAATKRYLRISNSVNKIFYTLIATVILMYLFLRFVL